MKSATLVSCNSNDLVWLKVKYSTLPISVTFITELVVFGSMNEVFFSSAKVMITTSFSVSSTTDLKKESPSFPVAFTGLLSVPFMRLAPSPVSTVQ